MGGAREAVLEASHGRGAGSRDSDRPGCSGWRGSSEGPRNPQGGASGRVGVGSPPRVWPSPSATRMTGRWRGLLTVVTAPSEVDARNVQDFWETLALACAHHTTVIVDMTGTKICGADAVVALLMALRYTDAAGTDIRIAASSAAAEAITSSRLPRRGPSCLRHRSPGQRSPGRSHRRPRGLANCRRSAGSRCRRARRSGTAIPDSTKLMSTFLGKAFDRIA